uniref:hypothetical protein n=1 Tax=Ruegeria arenilitoris TaxID=1173585 RepID=UPI00147B47EB|nr:hypothetical protein [Ruegeria arenilitoris]
MRFAHGHYEPQVVYGHRFSGTDELFHIGSGSYGRAIKPERGAPWVEYVGDRDVEVVIIETYQCPARARLREAELIFEMQPVTNHHHRNGPHKQVLRGFTKQGARCDCGAEDCYGREAARREA